MEERIGELDFRIPDFHLLNSKTKAIITLMEWGAFTSCFLHIVSLNTLLNYLCPSEQDRCEFYGCVDNNQDGCSNGLQCECKEGLERPNPQIAVCLGKCSACF